jgi:hypothetical protein
MKYNLAPNHRCSVPANHVAFDTETTPHPKEGCNGACQHTLHMGVARAWRYEEGQKTRTDELVFWDTAAFWQFVLARTHKRMPLWVWAHSLGFDLCVMLFWHHLEDGTFRIEDKKPPVQVGEKRSQGRKPWHGMLVTGDPPTMIVCRTKQGAEVRFVDTLNWFPCKLAEIGAELGLPKLEMPGESGDDSDWIEYCRRDAEIVEATVDALRDFVLVNDLGDFQMTVASQAMHFFRHRCLASKITIDHELYSKGLERMAYYGGRREIYFRGAVLPADQIPLAGFYGVGIGMPVLGKGPVYQLDVQSCYPSVMADHDYPVELVRTVRDPSPKQLREWLEGLAAVAEVAIDSGDEPWPYRDGGKTLWARGRVKTALCGPELIRALDMGVVTAVGLVQLYAKARPFDKFVRQAWELRCKYLQAGKPLHATLAKLVANALHGKFGQRQCTWELVPGMTAPHPWGFFLHYDTESGLLQRYRSVAWTTQLETLGGERSDTFPLIAAYTCSYAREKMRQLRIWAGLRDTLYEDCDSLHVTQAGYESLCRFGQIKDGELGKLKIQEVSDVAVYRAYRDFRLGERKVLAGVGAKAWQDPHGLFHQVEFLHLDALLMSTPPPGPVSTERVISRPEPSIRGTLCPDGWIDPIHVWR